MPATRSTSIYFDRTLKSMQPIENTPTNLFNLETGEPAILINSGYVEVANFLQLLPPFEFNPFPISPALSAEILQLTEPNPQPATFFVFNENSVQNSIGTDENDTISGSITRDSLMGLGGDDFIVGLESRWSFFPDDGDIIGGGEGNDTLYGNGGDDTIAGDGGNDLAYGGQGNDSIDGHEGDDFIWGDRGDDRLTGNAGMNVLSGGEGRDTFVSVLRTGSIEENTDIITDYNSTEDAIDWLNRSPNLKIVYEVMGRDLYIDASVESEEGLLVSRSIVQNGALVGSPSYIFGFRTNTDLVFTFPNLSSGLTFFESDTSNTSVLP